MKNCGSTPGDAAACMQCALREHAHQTGFRAAVDERVAALADPCAKCAHRLFKSGELPLLAPRYTVMFIDCLHIEEKVISERDQTELYLPEDNALCCLLDVIFAQRAVFYGVEHRMVLRDEIGRDDQVVPGLYSEPRRRFRRL